MTSNQFELQIKKQYIMYGILLFVFLLAASPFFKEGLPATDDYRHHATRFGFIAEQIDQKTYSEWMPSLYGGWPFFHFYHPMFYVLALPVLLFVNIFTALKIMTLLAYAVSLIGTYYGAKTLLGDERIAIITSVAYTLSSHFLFHATVSGALPRLMAFAMLPLTAAMFLKTIETEGHESNKKTKTKLIVVSGILFAALFMMHTAVAVPIIIICGIYALANTLLHKNSKSLISGALIILLAIALSAAWFIPLMTEKQNASFSDDSTVGSPLLLQSMRTFGFVKIGENDVRSNYFGYAVLALALVSVFFVRKNKTTNLLKIGFVASVLLYFNVFNILSIHPSLATSISGSSAYFSGILVFNAAMLAGIGTVSLIKSFKKEYLLYLFLAIIIIDLYPGIHAFSYGWVDQGTTNFMNPPQLVDAWRFISTQPGNFVVFSPLGQGAALFHHKQEFGFGAVGCPQCVDKETFTVHDAIANQFMQGQKNDTLLGYLGVKYYVVPCQANLPNKVAYTNNAVCVYENEEFRPIIDSTATISREKYGLDEISFTARAEKNDIAIIKSNLFGSHWHAYIDNKETPIQKAWPNYAMIQIPQGEHEITLTYKTTATHLFAWFITLLVAAGMIYLWRKQ